MRELGPGAEILVSPGDLVTPDSVIGMTKSGTRVVRLPLEQGETAAMLVLKRPGESLRRGEPLLQRPAFLGLACTEFVSPVDGYVEEILLAQRAVLIREHTAEVRAGVEGVVVDVLPDRGVLLRFDGTVIRFAAGWGPPVAGQLAPGAELSVPAGAARAIREEHQGKILWGFSRISAEAVLEAVRVGAAGIIGGSLSASELRGVLSQVKQKTGRERIPLTVLISEGFGSAPMAPDVRRHLGDAVGRAVYLDSGGSGGLWWTSDPEITFSSTVSAPVEPVAPDRVRVTDLEWFGAQGRLLAEAKVQALPTGLVCPVVAVELDSGEVIQVPLINVERLDGSSFRGR
jgi:uncharacterized protein (AIM24 family)